MALQQSDRGKGIPKLLPASTFNPNVYTTSTNPSTLLEPVCKLLFSILSGLFSFCLIQSQAQYMPWGSYTGRSD